MQAMGVAGKLFAEIVSVFQVSRTAEATAEARRKEDEEKDARACCYFSEGSSAKSCRRPEYRISPLGSQPLLARTCPSLCGWGCPEVDKGPILPLHARLLTSFCVGFWRSPSTFPPRTNGDDGAPQILEDESGDDDDDDDDEHHDADDGDDEKQRRWQRR